MSRATRRQAIAPHRATVAPATHTGTTGPSIPRRCRIRMGSGSSTTVNPDHHRAIDPTASGTDITKANHSAHGWRNPGAVGGSGDPRAGQPPRDDVLPLQRDCLRQLADTPREPTTPQVHPRLAGERRRERDGLGDREHDPLPTVQMPLTIPSARWPIPTRRGPIPRRRSRVMSSSRHRAGRTTVVPAPASGSPRRPVARPLRDPGRRRQPRAPPNVSSSRTPHRQRRRARRSQQAPCAPSAGPERRLSLLLSRSR